MKANPLLARALVFLWAPLVPLAGAGVASDAITIATVPVGNPGNAADSTGFGSVPYTYNIGKYDVTSSQYTAFLNAVAKTDTFSLYDSNMAFTYGGNPGIVQSGSSGSYTYSVAGGRDNFPVTDVSFWDTLRFANWLQNGQPTGSEGDSTTETGTYTLTPTAIANNTVTRNASLPPPARGRWPAKTSGTRPLITTRPAAIRCTPSGLTQSRPRRPTTTTQWAIQRPSGPMPTRATTAPTTKTVTFINGTSQQYPVRFVRCGAGISTPSPSPCSLA
jgi:hypothetical protein